MVGGVMVRGRMVQGRMVVSMMVGTGGGGERARRVAAC